MNGNPRPVIPDTISGQLRAGLSPEFPSPYADGEVANWPVLLHQLSDATIAVVGAVTTAWDTAQAVISAMGDRFVLIRIDSAGEGRQAAGRQAIGNTGNEPTMRAELAAVVAGVIAGMNTEPITVTDAETDILLAAADLVTLARTGVEYDYRGDVIDAHAPEMPTRFAKQLAQIVRGGVAIGMDRTGALRLAIRCARDSMPPLRLAIIDDLAEHPDSTTQDVRRRIDKPRATVDRQLQALHMLGVADVEEAGYTQDKVRWYYSLSADINPDAINPETCPDLLLNTPNPLEETEDKETEIQTDTPGLLPHKSGQVEDDPSLNGRRRMACAVNAACCHRALAARAARNATAFTSSSSMGTTDEPPLLCPAHSLRQVTRLAHDPRPTHRRRRRPPACGRRDRRLLALLS